MVSASATEAAVEPNPVATSERGSTLVCTSVIADTVDGAVTEIREAAEFGADVVELRLDFLKGIDLLDPKATLKRLLGACDAYKLPAIVTFRPAWEGGQFSGPEPLRLAVLKYAAVLGAAYVDVEYLAANFFFASEGEVPLSTKVILSHHDYDETPSDEILEALVKEMFKGGADIAKVATTAQRIEDSAQMLALPGKSSGPVIALAMGEKGLTSRILAPKFSGYLTFGALSPSKTSAPGQPTVSDLRKLYRLQDQSADTQVFGIVGNPVSHSRSPALHNAALAAAGMDAVYVPLLVDELRPFLDAFPSFSGFSVTIPHKLAALECADEADPVAVRIGAANTLVRQPGGGLKAYNTDWSAAISAVEAGLRGEESVEAPLKGERVVVVGAGGAGRALAFGALERGAAGVILCNRTREKADALAAALGDRAEAVDYADVASGKTTGDVLLNSTSIGMHPAEEETPVSAEALGSYKLVFDAVYTPLQTRLLKEAQEQGCITVSGLEMFVGQAAEQFELFTSKPAPVELMRQATLDSMQAH
ncbi:probable shikimate dehydrogenase (NADP(+)) at C-terminar half [Coccomyxa sp. Obi]|nr:probable shikimate dehydrogenase (NADP(+)) at C-terminar half [Coccomyxa sp. Obi]